MSNSKRPGKYVLATPGEADRARGDRTDAFPPARERRRMFISPRPQAATGEDTPATQAVNVEACRRRHASSSFLPHPDILRQYAEVIPDAPERILRILEADSAHLRERQLKIIQAKTKDTHRIHWMTYSFIAGGYGTAVLFAVMNRDILAGIVLTTTIIGTVTGFMKQRLDSATGVSDPDTPAD